MIENIGGVTSQLIGASLDALMTRHELIANNIANANTSGFEAKKLDFEQQLQSMLSSFLTNKDIEATKNEVAEFKEQLMGEEFVSDTAHEVQLDEEMVALTENTLRYQALLTASGKRGDIIKMAIREGR